MKKLILTILILFLISILNGCGGVKEIFKPSYVENSEEVGNVFVSAYPVIPWSDVSTQLSPQFNYSTADAQKLALQTTQSQFNQALSTLALGLGLSLPLKTQITTENEKGTTFTKSESEGSPPNSSNVGSTSVSAISPTTNQNANLGVASDTLLTNTEAILYRTKIADSRISKQYLDKGYTAQLITFQINLQPRKRNLPYDTYVDISLFPDPLITNDKKLDNTKDEKLPIIIYPLLISDAMEATSVNNTLQNIRQALLQLSGTIGVVGANSGLGAGKSETAQIVGSDKNSLLTVGIVKDSMVRVRIGAENSADAEFEMVPKSINVSLLVLGKDSITEIKAISNEQFIDAKSGSVLAGDTNRRIKLAKQVANNLEYFDFNCTNEKFIQKTDPKLYDLSLSKFEEICKKNCINLYLDLLRDANLGKYEKVIEDLDCDDKKLADKQATVFRLLAKLNQLNVLQAYSTMHIPLKRKVRPELPPDQAVVLTDDNKVLTAVFRSGKGLDASKLKAMLNVKSNNLTLYPINLSTSNNNSEISVSFPSLKQAKIKPENTTVKLFVTDQEVNSVETEREYTSWYIYEKDDKEKTPNPLATSVSQILPDKKYSSIVTLTVSEYKTIEGYALPLKLIVEGADVRSPIGNIEIKPGAHITLKLGNLSPIKPVSFIVMDKNKKTIGSPLVIPVLEGNKK